MTGEVPKLTAKRVLVELLSASEGGEGPVQELVRAASVMGITENNVRVALARMKASRLVEVGERGSYRLGVASRGMHEEAMGWRSRESWVEDWGGLWLGICAGELTKGRRKKDRQRRRALRLLGFCVLRDGLCVRPDNLRGGLGFVRKRLEQLGMEGGLVFQIGAWEKETEVQARGLWDVDTLHEGYDTMCQALSQSAARLSQMAPEDGAREAFLLGSQAIRQILLDPLLPAPLVEVARRRAFVEAMLEYDALGRRLWQELMPGIREGASGSGDDRMQGEAGAALGFSQEMETSGDLDAERQKAR